ncbi:MAG: methyltransferase domain-containing protein [Rhodospirillales bacterium]|nr:methyltransferase domain-containing protein [Rhodospirillales bacterium]
MTNRAAEVAIDFNDGAQYERFMGRWSRAVGAMFLDWLSPPKSARWLEVGCGTGAFTDLILRSCEPSAIVALDSSVQQIDWARSRLQDERLHFQVAGADLLLFPPHSFDVVASALVINFLAEPSGALYEMRRVARPGGSVAAYVWDFAAGRAPNACLVRGLRQMGAEVPQIPGTEVSTLDGLTRLFQTTGFYDIQTTALDITVEFDEFDDFWASQTPGFSPVTKIIASLSASARTTLTAIVRDQAVDHEGRVAWSARANAIKARTA